MNVLLFQASSVGEQITVTRPALIDIESYYNRSAIKIKNKDAMLLEPSETLK